MPPARVIVIVCMLASTLATPSRAAEKLPAHRKLVYRQIGAGWTLGIPFNDAKGYMNTVLDTFFEFGEGKEKGRKF